MSQISNGVFFTRHNFLADTSLYVLTSKYNTLQTGAHFAFLFVSTIEVVIEHERNRAMSSSFSVNTNVAALDALQTLNTTARELDSTRLRVSSGLNINGAKDNAAIFAIAQNLRASDTSLTAVTQSLNRTKSVLDVSINAGEEVQTLLISIREKVVAASDAGQPVSSINALKKDFESLRDQLRDVVRSATFNGVNLIDGPSLPPGKPDSVSAVTSPDGLNKIVIPRINFQLFDDVPTTTGGVVSSTGTTTSNTGGIGVVQGVTATSVAKTAGVVQTQAAGATVYTTSSSTDSITIDGSAIQINGGTTVTPGGVTIFAGNQYTLTPPDATTTTNAQTAVALAGTTNPKIRITGGSVSVIDGIATVTSGKIDVIAGTVTTQAGTPSVPSTVIPVPETVTPIPASNVVQIRATDTFIDAASAEALLSKIDLSIKLTGDGLATLGAASRNIDQQITFTSKLSDTFKTGIGSLVDANLAVESAKLQSLSVKQQLGTQALSLANAAPQSILQLFK